MMKSISYTKHRLLLAHEFYLRCSFFMKKCYHPQLAARLQSPIDPLQSDYRCIHIVEHSVYTFVVKFIKWIFSAKRRVTSAEDRLKSDFQPSKIYIYIYCCLYENTKLWPSCVKNATSTKVRKKERKPFSEYYIIPVSSCGTLKYVYKRRIYFRNYKNQMLQEPLNNFI